MRGYVRPRRNTAAPEAPHAFPPETGARYGARHAFDKVLIAPAIEVAEERVAQIVLPADGIDRVYGRRVPGRIAVAEPTVVAVNRKAQLSSF